MSEERRRHLHLDLGGEHVVLDVPEVPLGGRPIWQCQPSNRVVNMVYNVVGPINLVERDNSI